MNDPWYKDKAFWTALLGFLSLLIGQIITYLKAHDAATNSSENRVEVQQVREHQETNGQKIDSLHKEVRAARMGTPPSKE